MRREALRFFNLSELAKPETQALSQIDSLVSQKSQYKSIQKQWNEFKKAFWVKSVGEIYAEFAQLQTQIKKLEPVEALKLEQGAPKSIEENKDNFSKISIFDEWQSPALKGAVFLRRRRANERQEEEPPHLSPPEDPNLIPDVLSGLPLERQVELLNKQEKIFWALSMYKSVLSDTLAPAAIWTLLARATREKNIEAQKLFLQPEIYLILRKHYSLQTTKWIQKADPAVRQEYTKLGQEIDQAI